MRWTKPEAWRERVKRAVAPRTPVVDPESVEAVRIPWLPSELLVGCLVSHGMPHRHAVTIRESKQLYYIATRFYFDVADAEAGDAEARARVEHFTMYQKRLRLQETEELGQNPDRLDPVESGPSKRRSQISVPRGLS